jgi:hypothetical protein
LKPRGRCIDARPRKAETSVVRYISQEVNTMSMIRRFARATLATLTLASIALAGSTAQADIREPLTPENSAVLLVDLQPQYAFSVHSIDADKLINNATGLSKAARVFGVPTIFTTINAKSFAGSMFTQFANARPMWRRSIEPASMLLQTSACNQPSRVHSGRRYWSEACGRTAA